MARWANGPAPEARRLPFLVIAPMLNLGRHPAPGGGLINGLGDLAVGMPVVGTLQSQRVRPGEPYHEGSLGFLEWDTTSSQEWKLEAPVSFYGLESEFSTDLLMWAEFAVRETEVILPPVPELADLVIFLNHERGRSD